MRFVVWFFVLLFGSTLAWRYYPRVDAGLKSQPAPSKPIVFDNGTVRQYLPPPEPGSAPLATSLPQGALRKCVKGKQKTYTNISCPPGHEELPVSSDRLTVLSGQGPVRPAQALPAAERRSTLRDALDLSADDQLRQRIVDRAADMRTK